MTLPIMENINTGGGAAPDNVANMASLSPIEKDSPVSLKDAKDNAQANAPSPPDSVPEADATGGKETVDAVADNETTKPTDAPRVTTENESVPVGPTETTVDNGSVQTEMLKEQLPEATDPDEGTEAVQAALMSGALPQIGLAEVPIASAKMDSKDENNDVQNSTKTTETDAPTQIPESIVDQPKTDESEKTPTSESSTKKPKGEEDAEALADKVDEKPKAVDDKEGEAKAKDDTEAKANAPEPMVIDEANLEEKAENAPESQAEAPALDTIAEDEPEKENIVDKEAQRAAPSKKRKVDELCDKDDDDEKAKNAAKRAKRTATRVKKIMAMPIGRSERKTRSQGPV